MSLPSGTNESDKGISQAVFDAVTRNLLDIGCISVQEYLYGSPKPVPVTTFSAAGLALSPPVPDMLPSTSAAKPTETVNVNAVSQLHQTCQRVFGSTDALKFEFVEEKGPRSKQCILTIVRPDGSKRSYTTQPTFARKNEAKSEAAKIAIEMGALDFLMRGEGNTSKIKQGLLASIAETSSEEEAVSGIPSETSDHGPSPIGEIERCCAQWRAGRVALRWVAFFEPKLGNKQGCALRIELSPHVIRIYLSEPAFDKYGEARLACAQVAISEGVLDFIKHGNGQTRPSSPQPFTSTLMHCTSPVINTRTPLTLQNFYDSLPRPFPERFDTDDAYEVNAPGWLNTMFQNARGGKLAMSFFFTSDNTPGLHGCLLKLDRPGDYRAYLVDSRFTKRSDAKAAVCLQAMSLGVGEYIREITSAVGTQVTSAMRSFSTNIIYPTMTAELSRIDAGLHPRFDFEKHRDAFGASLIIELSTSPTAEQVRRYAVPCDYRNKADAKAAAVCQAAEHGVIEFIRFRGGQLPLGYVSPYTLRSYNPDAVAKRRLEDVEASEEGKSSKKRKKASISSMAFPSQAALVLRFPWGTIRLTNLV
ncbi:hypothetical protein F5I97DRAFT_1025287 [Phlebopus sp. FC_14]|nr:hypothetical protein F5I97DRAFT_1025287 [Phlebopus sp. FC_14]